MHQELILKNAEWQPRSEQNPAEVIKKKESFIVPIRQTGGRGSNGAGRDEQVATAAHQGWSANLFTLTSDMFPRRAVGSVVGIAGMAGAIGGVLVAKVAGYLREWTGSYVPLFTFAASAYLVALLVIHLLVPRMETANVGDATPPLSGG